MYDVLKKIMGIKNTERLFELFFILKHLYILLIYAKIKRKKKTNNIFSKKQILLGLIPNHSNLGDYALYISAKEMITNFFPDYNIIELKINDTSKKIYDVRSMMNKDSDIVILIGGGNMGTRYLTEEFIRQLMFYTFRNFRRIQLPQSYSYEKNSLLSWIFYIISRKIYSINHDKLLITTRDIASFDLFKDNFNNKILLLPDNVLYLSFSKVKKNENHKVLYCLREDKESKYNKKERDEIISYIKNKYSNSKEFDTINKTPDTNELAFKQLITEINGAELVITDRLHGLILSYISNTPVIAITTNDHKLRDFFKLIKGSSKSFLIEDITEIEKIKINPSIDNYIFKSDFEVLKYEILKL